MIFYESKTLYNLSCYTTVITGEVIMSNVKLGLHMRFIAYDSFQTCSFISHCLEIYTIAQREY